jgi:hypothetical protein
MKTTLTILGILLWSLLPAQQQQCEVKLNQLQGEYSGQCRKGLAHGSGVAIGEDQYGGQFRNGLPHGEGVYTWSNGDIFEGNFRRGLPHGKGKLTRIIDGEQVIMTGTWRNGEYVEPQSRQRKYQVDRQRSIDHVRITQTGQGQQVRVKIWRSGSPLRYSNLRVINSSGNQVLQGQDIVFEHVTFPFTFSLFYSVTNKMRTSGMDCELQVTIIEEGNWEVITVQ